jgi:hypothetical protein
MIDELNTAVVLVVKFVVVANDFVIAFCQLCVCFVNIPCPHVVYPP